MIDAGMKSAFDAVRRAPDGSRTTVDRHSLLKTVLLGVETGELTAVWHPVGFFYFDVSAQVDAEPGVQHRIHIWSELRERSDGLGSIHDHTWRLTSAVLTGEIEDVNYVATPNPDGAHRFVRVSYTDSGNEFTDDGRFDVSESRRRAVPAGMVYRLDADVLHTTVVTQSPTVTMVIADRRGGASASPLVLLAADTAPKATGPRPAVDREVVGRALNLAMSALGHQAGHSATIGQEAGRDGPA